VTHDQIEAMTLADRVVLLRDGVIEQQGAPLDLFERPATRFVAGFLGSPKMNFISATLSGKTLTLADGTRLVLPEARKSASGAVILGIRPQHIAKAGKTVAAGHARLATTIELLQPTGSRLHVTFPLGGGSAVAELEAHDAKAPGEKLALDIDMTRAIVIDPTSGRVI
jgi:multiple sugar transport system ATP-binding protein